MRWGRNDPTEGGPERGASEARSPLGTAPPQRRAFSDGAYKKFFCENFCLKKINKFIFFNKNSPEKIFSRVTETPGTPRNPAPSASLAPAPGGADGTVRTYGAVRSDGYTQNLQIWLRQISKFCPKAPKTPQKAAQNGTFFTKKVRRVSTRLLLRVKWIQNFVPQNFESIFQSLVPFGSIHNPIFFVPKKIWRFFRKMPPAFFEKSPRFFPVSFLKNFDPFGVKIFQK